MKKKNLITMLSLGALVFTAAPALAQRGDGQGFRGQRGQGMRGKRMQQQLGLTEDQVTQIKALRTSHRQQMQSIRTQLTSLRQQMRRVLSAPVVDEGQAMTQHKQIQSYMQLVREARFKHRLQVMRLLTQEQRATLVEGRGKRGKRGFGGRGFGGRGIN